MIQRKNRDGPMGHGKPSKIEKLWISWRYLWVFFMNDDFCVLKPANKIVKHLENTGKLTVCYGKWTMYE